MGASQEITRKSSRVGRVGLGGKVVVERCSTMKNGAGCKSKVATHMVKARARVCGPEEPGVVTAARHGHKLNYNVLGDAAPTWMNGGSSRQVGKTSPDFFYAHVGGSITRSGAEPVDDFGEQTLIPPC
ncbi:unnamed protein product [Pleuronectes platessa]|uniref:Uncharacterized protein n=1 Tax=Pleuronectes platessa TaxID=8262 RepID=A0A9N7TPK1_PLEPL|nr:unnamed protein product [Pleuronectes platessa]